jgi:hypothetical protein
MQKGFQVLKRKVAQVKTPDAHIPVLVVEFVLIRPKSTQTSRVTESCAPSAKTMRKPCVKTQKKRKATTDNCPNVTNIKIRGFEMMEGFDLLVTQLQDKDSSYPF